MYSTENGEKFIVVERWNRTIKQSMWKQFTVQGNTQDLDILPQIVLKYNNTKHSSLKMTPTEASIKKNKGTVYFNLYDDIETSTKPKFKVGDKVRISKYKSKRFSKDILQIGQKRCLLLTKFCIPIPSLTKSRI